MWAVGFGGCVPNARSNKIWLLFSEFYRFPVLPRSAVEFGLSLCCEPLGDHSCPNSPVALPEAIPNANECKNMTLDVATPVKLPLLFAGSSKASCHIAALRFGEERLVIQWTAHVNAGSSILAPSSCSLTYNPPESPI